MALLYSTNVYLKYHIQREYRGGSHFAWCSETFDSSKAGAYTKVALVPPSANPADIYRDLAKAVKMQDTHNAKITSQKATLTTLALGWATNGEITDDQKDEIIYMVERAGFEMWRPMLYIVPRTASIEARWRAVPMAKRAGFGPEYIIEDLREDEFDVIEF